MSPTEVIRRVREDGGDLIARDSPDTCALEVLCPGFPLLGVGSHRAEGDRPGLRAVVGATVTPALR